MIFKGRILGRINVSGAILQQKNAYSAEYKLLTHEGRLTDDVLTQYNKVLNLKSLNKHTNI
ncbi:hypothetical protein TUM4636_24110 [Shewanella glacialipiscicola]|uniref:Uncharacterized protein n=1 Tax=Shewanella glacialipiscicola TaxID=614069 RepID=A0ABQ6J2I5_9GAMM|nr:hypothetical protein TUM4636_24110 [Shewanella glacialipiscicola]GMA81721.1 hypothetical protein GCM10025855_12540 [Shewanella glacialipiscicola]GMA84594.1 hypothetical protein GCM10025855_41280 [Shewanella glacialipiscicola]